jgi:hypothetical protein
MEKTMKTILTAVAALFLASSAHAEQKVSKPVFDYFAEQAKVSR